MDPYKLMLISVKESACGIATLVANLSGPLTDPQVRAEVQDLAEGAGGKIHCLLYVDTSTLYAPSSVTLYWQPVSTTGLGLSAVAAKACEEACKALDAYCRAIGDPPSGDPYGYAGLTVPQLLAAASLALWQCENLLRDTLRRAGIT